MDLRAYYVEAAEAAAAVHTTEDDVPKLTPEAVLLKLEVQGIGLGGDADDAPALPPYGKGLSGQGNGVAPTGMDSDKAAEGGGARDLACPECGKAFLSDKAMYGHLRCHPEKGYKGATRPKDAATAAVVGGKKPRKVPRKEAEFSTMSPAATAAVDGDKKAKKVPWKEAETRWPLTAKRGRMPPTAKTGSAAPVAVLQSTCSEEEAAMILLEMSSWGQTPEPELPMQLAHVADAVAGHQMPGVEQPMLPDHVADAVAMHHEPVVEHPMIPDRHVASAVAGQHMWEAEKPAQLEHVFKVIMQPHAPEAEQALRPEHVAKVTAEPQTPEVENPMELEHVTDAVLVVLRNKNGAPANKPVSPGAKKTKKRRLLDLERTPASQPPEAADVKPPERRIPSPASDRRYGCPTCHKTFPTHQALGGHMASHNKGKDGGAQHVDGLAVAHAMHNIMAHHHRHGVTAADAGLGEGRPDSPPAPMAQSPAQHPCSRCHLTFPTGQALGGHMRKHWLADKLLAKAAAAAASGVPRDFDLNELPGNEGEN